LDSDSSVRQGPLGAAPVHSRDSFTAQTSSNNDILSRTRVSANNDLLSRTKVPSSNDLLSRTKVPSSNDLLSRTKVPSSNDLLSRTKVFKPPRSSKSTAERTAEPVILKPTNSATLLGCQGDKKISAFSNYKEIQSISSSLSNMSVKSKTNGTARPKTKSSSRPSVNGATVKRDKTAKSEPVKATLSKAAEAARIRSEESLRWEFAVDDEEQERERIKVYKINRRKRYLAAAQAKGLGWVVNYGNNGFPIVDDSLTELREREMIHTTISDFSPVHTIMAGQSNTTLNLGTEIAC